MTERERCPSTEDLASFLEGKLHSLVRERIIEHLASCQRCRAIVEDSFQFLRSEEAREVLPFPKRRIAPSGIRWRWILAAAALLVLALLLVLLVGPMHRTEKEPSTTSPLVATGPKPSGPLPPSNSPRGPHPPPNPKEPQTPPKPGGAGPAPTPSKFRPATCSEMADLLTRNRPDKEWSALAWKPGEGGYAFGTNLNAARCSFRAGVLLLDLEVALRTGDARISDDTAGEILGILDGCEGLKSQQDPPREVLVEIRSSLKEGRAPASLAGHTAKAEPFFEKTGSQVHFRLGKWSEGGRLAATMKAQVPRDPEAARYFLSAAKEARLSFGVQSALRSIEATTDKEGLGDQEYAILQGAFAKIIELEW